MRKQLALLAVAAVVAVGCANDGDSDAASQEPTVVRITMLDNRYEPNAVTVPRDTPVTFEFTNEGTVDHEALVGDEHAQTAHAEEMATSTSADSGHMGGMDHSGAEGAITVKPGLSDTVTTTFNTDGTFLIGCHVPLHYEQGMKATINVA